MRQFGIGVCPLEEKANTVGGQQGGSQRQQPSQGRERACCDQGRRRQVGGLDPHRVYADRSAGHPRCFGQECGLAAVRLDQIERDSGCQSQHQAWKACSGAQIDPTGSSWRDEGHELEGILNMPLP